MITMIRRIFLHLSNSLEILKGFSKVEQLWIVVTQILIIMGEITIVLVIKGELAEKKHLVRSEILVAGIVCIILANISTCILIPYLLQQVTKSMNIDYSRELSNMEYKYYEIAVENDKKIRTLRHDISNHIQTVYSLLKNGENQKGLALVDELKERYACIEQIVYCDNPVVNIILSNKRNEAELKGIETNIKVRENLENIPISDFDLSTLICNLLDNAIRGCIDSEQSRPRLIVEMLCKNQYLVIRVLNSCKVSMNIESTDRIKTTKVGSQAHGYGMTIISGIAKKYRGDFVVSAQNGIFTATTVMPMK